MKQELSQKTIDIIKESADLISEKNIEITQKMYEILFKKNPQLKILFANASADQHIKLANTISAYAHNIDQLYKLEADLNIIALSHVNVKVRPDHYPIVGRAFINALEFVLVDDLDDEANIEFLDAWKEAYEYLAYILIDMEKKLYKQIN